MGNYVNQLKKDNPEAYKKLTAVTGENPEDWQAQIFTPIYASRLNNIIDKKRFEKGDIPEYLTPEYSDESGKPTGYTQQTFGYDTGSGYPITVHYSPTGDITGYTADQGYRNWVGEHNSYGGSWDASGKPVPVAYESHGGGALSDFLGSDIGGIASLVAMYYGVPWAAETLGISNAAASAALNMGKSVASGVPLDAAIQGAAQSAALGQIGSGVSSAALPSLTDAGLTADQASSASKILGQAAKTAVAGGDPLQALLSGGISAGTAAITSEIPGFSDMSKSQQAAVNAAVSQTLQDKDPTQGLINAAIKEGLGVIKNTPAEAGDKTMPMQPAGDKPGYYDEITGKFVEDENGALPSPLDNTSGTNLDSMKDYTYDAAKNVWTQPDGTAVDLSYLSNNQTPLDTSKLDQQSPSASKTNWDSLLNKALLGGAAAIGAKALTGNNATQPAAQPAAPEQTVNWNPQTGTVVDGVAYGLAQLNPTFTQNAAQGGIMSLGGYASGGNPRLLKGPGDGMSDNIPATIAGKQPARLADGEFVVPADVVSHLGNGSTEAGANVLYQMMERVRKARTGNSKQSRQINPQKFIPSKGK